MPTSKEKPHEITLSGFTFANPQAWSKRETEEGDAEERVQPNFQAGFGFARQESHERMAADNLGQELDNEATIWKIYREEADEHDQELARGQHANLDVMLLFAALFSAVLTAFLIESKNLLQQDPADISAALLLLIAQSQYRMELGTPASSDQISEPTVPEFSPSQSAHWINGMWFVSLGLSLSAALVAMLGKEWLTAFLSSRPRPAHDHALLRQARLEGLERWWALHIIALLPSILHVSLLLFAIGLVLYLWTLNKAIAAVLAAVVAVTLIFYFTTAILGAIYEFCPYVSQFSRYMRRALFVLFGNKFSDGPKALNYSVLKDLQALLWLSDNAQDPTVVDCSYQAMAGLQNSIHADLNGEITKQATDNSAVQLPVQLNDEVTLFSLLATLVERYEQLTSRVLDLSGRSEMAAARYLSAIMAVFAHLQRTPDIPIEPYSSVPPQIQVSQLLAMTEAIWTDNSPSLTANTYASVLISAMDMMLLVTSILSGRLVSPSDSSPSGQPGLSNLKETPNDAYIVDVDPNDSSEASPSEDLVNLRACYSRWLARTSTLIGLFTNRRISMDAWLLDGLLKALAKSARYDTLNPQDSISTHQTEHPDPDNQDFSFSVPTNLGQPHSFRINHLKTSPLGKVIDLLKENITNKARVRICLTAVQAYSVLAPVILQQAFKISRDELQNAFDINAWQYWPTASLSGLRFIVVRQSLLTIRYMGTSRTTSPGHYELLKSVMELLNTCFDADENSSPSKKNSYLALANHNHDLVPLLEFAGESEANLLLLPSAAQSSLLRIARLPFTSSGMNACDNLLTPGCFLALIRMVADKKVKSTYTSSLFQSMARRMRLNQSTERPQRIPWNDVSAIEYLYPFARTSQGFTLLSSVGHRKTHAKAALDLIIDVVHLAAGRDPALVVEPVELSPSAVPVFCDAVLLVLRNRALGSRDKKIQLLSFFDDVLELTKAAIMDDISGQILRQHVIFKDIWKVLKSLWANEAARGLRNKYQSAQSEFGILVEEPRSEKQQPVRKSGKPTSMTAEGKSSKQTEGNKLNNAASTKTASKTPKPQQDGSLGENRSGHREKAQKDPISTENDLQSPEESSMSDLDISDDDEEEDEGIKESEIEDRD